MFKDIKIKNIDTDNIDFNNIINKSNNNHKEKINELKEIILQHIPDIKKELEMFNY